MTKEEAIETIKDICLTTEQLTRIEKALECLLSQPSLPSNLDHASQEYAYNNWEDNDYHTGASEGLPFDAIGHTKKCFKAGAEWMAGQGVKIGKTKIYLEDDGDEPPYSQEWLDLESTEFKIPDGAFKNGDEVDVILRKKQ